MDETVVSEVEIDKSEKLVHQLSKLVLGVVAGFLVGELVKVSYDKFVINRNSNNSEQDD